MIFDPILDLLRGKAISIPPLDGVFRPNTQLDDAPVIAALEQADNLAGGAGRILASSGQSIYELAANGEPRPVQSFNETVTALAISDSGEVAIALDSGKLLIDGVQVVLPPELKCITALVYAQQGVLWLANGSARNSPSSWVVDLMEKGASGSIWFMAQGSRQLQKLAGGLAYPYGLLLTGGDIVVSESWRHRLVRFNTQDGKKTVVADDLPGYPSRISASATGGAWLSIFAPRNRLIEFVLQENAYRRDMMKQVERDHWIAPALASGRSFLEPLQCGGIKVMGIHKPWAPSRSYGLVVGLDQNMIPTTSLHSRANGLHHGICSAIEDNGRLLVAAKGSGCVLDVDVAAKGVPQHG